MTDTSKVKITLEYDKRELMSAVLDNLLARNIPSFSWDNEKTSGYVIADDPETDKQRRYHISGTKLAKGLELAIKAGMVSPDMDEWDCYDSYNVLQYALYGELIYG